MKHTVLAETKTENYVKRINCSLFSHIFFFHYLKGLAKTTNSAADTTDEMKASVVFFCLLTDTSENSNFEWLFSVKTDPKLILSLNNINLFPFYLHRGW